MNVDWIGWLVWGFVATVLLTTVMAASQMLQLTRMNLPYMLGVMFTPDRDKARLLGFLVHQMNGWIFSLIYILGFHSLGSASWWLGALGGLLHGLFVLLVGMTLMPGLHPRMASEQQGPTVVRQLEPPGFLALHYGARTPVSVLVAHVLYGAVLGGFYALPG